MGNQKYSLKSVCLGAIFPPKISQGVPSDRWAGQRSRYSDWVRAGRFGDRIQVGSRFSAPVQTGPGAHPVSCTMGTASFPGVKSGRGVTLTPSPPSSAVVSTPSMGRTACAEPQCLYMGVLYLYLINITRTRHSVTLQYITYLVPLCDMNICQFIEHLLISYHFLISLVPL